jgi:ATP-dependent Lhr-like helicase
MRAVENWFRARGFKPFRFQREAWSAYLDGKSGLVHAATGTGKTQAAWLGPLIEGLREGRAKEPPPLRVLWITPLRALANDTLQALRDPAELLETGWAVGLRTGDTSQAERRRQRERLPTALVTTPESLCLFLATPGQQETFSALRCVVVDEWHELFGTKRGVLLELALARLRALSPGLRVWGLSATLGNTDEAAAALAGPGAAIVKADLPKKVVVDAAIPREMERFPWAGHIGTRLLGDVIEAIEGSRSTLVFTNVRSQTEIWHRALLEARPDWEDVVAIHHGSLDRERRDEVEQGLRDGRLRAVVCTSSLDLGVDFSPVDRVVQVGSPKGVARILQRAGRSGHRPGETSRITCVPTHALELVEIAAVRDAVERREIEGREVVWRPLDVLAQHLITVASGGGFEEAAMLAEVRSTFSYRDLGEEEWRFTLDFVERGGETLRAYPEYRRVVPRDGRWVLGDAKVAARHRMAIGTIVSDPAIEVRYLSGGRLGTVEESFVAKMQPGDRFVFAGKPVAFVRLRETTCYVRRAAPGAGGVPQWAGGRMPLSTQLAHAVRRRLDAAAEGRFDGPEMRAVRPVLDTQAAGSRIPRADELLVERLFSPDGWHLFFYPFEGRLVHEGLAALFAWRIAKRARATFSLACNDHGFELLSAARVDVERALEQGLLSAEGLAEDIAESLNAGALAKRHFREVARIAGLVVTGFPGRGVPARRVQASAELFYDVFAKYDPGNLLLRQAGREVLERQLEASRLRRTLERLRASRVVVVDLERPTPFAFPLMVDRLRETLTNERLEDRVRRMRLTLEAEATAPARARARRR